MTGQTPVPGTVAAATAARPGVDPRVGPQTPAGKRRQQQIGTTRLAWLRTGVEMKNLFRNRQAFAFTVLFPVMMVVLFASIFNGTVEGTDVRFSQLYVAGIIGSSLMSTGFVSLSIGLAAERESGMLKRLASTPMPKSAFFLGKIGMVIVTLAIEVAVLVALGIAFFHVSLPTDAGSWLTFTWVLVLGTTAATLLGIAVGGLIRDSKSAPAVVNLPFVALQFVSGVWISVSDLPSWLITVAKVFPLYWICRAMRSVFLPDGFSVIESGDGWQLGTAALVLGIWCIVGFVLCVRTFRWTRD